VVELVRHILSQDTPEVQAVACEGVAKLMLAGMISDATVCHAVARLIADSTIIGVAVFLPGNFGQSTSSSMLILLPTRLLLLFPDQPASYVIGESVAEHS
jgi:hypothetical protein